jgi:hypothetical protein
MSTFWRSVILDVDKRAQCHVVMQTPRSSIRSVCKYPCPRTNLVINFSSQCLNNLSTLFNTFLQRPRIRHRNLNHASLRGKLYCVSKMSKVSTPRRYNKLNFQVEFLGGKAVFEKNVYFWRVDKPWTCTQIFSDVLYLESYIYTRR